MLTDLTANPTQAAVIAALSVIIDNSNEPQALLDIDGKLLFKNELCKLAPENNQLPLPSRPIAANTLVEYQTQIVKLLPLTEHLILVKPLPSAILAPSTATEQNLLGIADNTAFEQALSKAELTNKNRLLVMIKVEATSEDVTKSSLLNTIVQLLSSCWRSGDKIFYLQQNEFAILYNNAPDMELVSLRLASLENILHYKGYKNIMLHIGHSTLEQANMQTKQMVMLAREALNNKSTH